MKFWVKICWLMTWCCWSWGTQPLLAQSDWKTQLVALEEKTVAAPTDTLRSRLFGQMSELCAHHLIQSQQLAFADSCLWYAERSKVPIILINAYRLKADALIGLDSIHQAMLYLDRAAKIGEDHPELLTDPVYINCLLTRLKKQRIYQNVPSKVIVKELEKLYEQIKQQSSPSLLAQVLNPLVIQYRSLNQLDRALFFNERLLKVIDQTGDPLQEIRAKITDIDIYFNLMTTPVDSLQLSQLIEKCRQTYDLTQTANLPIYKPWPLLYWSKFHWYAKNYPEARHILEQIDEAQVNTITRLSKYDLLADIELDAGQDAQMYAFAKKAQQLAKQAQHDFFQLKINNFLLHYFLASPQRDSMAFYVQEIEQGLEKVDTSQFLEVIYHSYELLSQYYKSQDLSHAMSLLETANRVREKRIYFQQKALANIATYRQTVASLESDQVQLRENSQNLSSQNRFLIVLALLLSIGGMVWYYRSKHLQNQQKQLQRQQAIAEAAVQELSEQSQKKHLILNNKTKIYLDELRYVKSDGNYVEFYVQDQKHLDRNRLKQVAAQLPPNFVQIHRSYIINRNFIKVQQANTVILEPHVEVPISRTYKTQLFKSN